MSLPMKSILTGFEMIEFDEMEEARTEAIRLLRFQQWDDAAAQLAEIERRARSLRELISKSRKWSW